MPIKFEFRVTGTAPDPEDRARRWSNHTEFLINAADEIQSVLARRWPLIPWRLEAVTPTSEPPAIALKTGDGRFDPLKPVTINGYRFIPAPASQQGPAPAQDTVAVDPKRAQPCVGNARREGDEMVCCAPFCGLRWAVDEERPGCPQ